MTIDLKRIYPAALAALVLLAGCGKEEPEASKPDPYDTQYARMHDPEYLKAIEVKRAEQKAIMRDMAAARRGIAAFKEAHPGEEVPAELTKKLDDAAAELEKNRILSQALVRDRIQRETKAIDARKERENFKKGK